MKHCERLVFLLGHGARGADLAPLLALKAPVLTSWQAQDMIDNNHPHYFGSPGIYGQRTANTILHHADRIIAIGNRMSIWNVGYEGPRADQSLLMVDVDDAEVKKFPHAKIHRKDAKTYIAELARGALAPESADWLAWCEAQRLPWVESPAHDDANGYINSYRFVDALHPYLRDDEVIVTDMGTALICAHQVLRLKPPQRLLTSGGLGEMGCALPAAIGASFARDKGEVLCLHCDGGMMMNLQELATIMHHKLPIKIIVFENDGYDMIRKTQEKSGQQHVAVDKASGITLPSYRNLAHAWGMMAADVQTWEDFEQTIPVLFDAKEPALIAFHMDPNQKIVPKLDPIYVDGKPTSPRFDQMSPAL